MSQQVPEPKGHGFFKRLTDCRAAVRTGCLVSSAMGRDRGKFYLVIGSDSTSRVKVADGEVRKVENPKRKNIKHLHFYDAVAKGVSTKAESGNRITNVDIRRELKSLLESPEQSSK